ncbi:MAG: glycosyltransferase family 39 protein [Anaerolineales bacterium]|nr:glycosyltransferase family 39 protein [Anaerolineales bacterium]
MTSKKHNTYSWIYDILLLLVLAMAAWLRLAGANWGEQMHQHPDELFLTSVVANLQAQKCVDPALTVTVCPEDEKRWLGVGDYFNTSESTLNPHNRGFAFFVYGTLPVFIVRYTAEIAGMTDAIKLLGRQFSAMADLGTILLLYFFVARLYNRRTALLAALFSSLAVMQIQQSHFFTTDLFVNFFMFLAIYFAVRILVYEHPVGQSTPGDEVKVDVSGKDQVSRQSVFSAGLKKPLLWLSVGFGLAFGMAMASKVNAFPLAILLPAAFAIRAWTVDRRHWAAGQEGEETGEASTPGIPEYWSRILVYLVIGGFTAFLAFRIFQPYAFNGVGINQQWLDNILEQRAQATGEADLPWNLQWARRTRLYSFKNLTVWGLGLPLGILAWSGFLWMGWRILRGEYRHLLLWGWTAFYFGWQSLQFNPTMRYQLPVYPLLAMMAAWTVFQLARLKTKAGDTERPASYSFRTVSAVICVLVAASTAVWAFAFQSIYLRDEPRIAASRWIYQNVPAPINIRYEGKQKPLPVPANTTVQRGLPYTTSFSFVNEAVADGEVTLTLSEVLLPHVGAPYGSGDQTLTLKITASSDVFADKELASVSVLKNFSPADDPRGKSASFLFEPALKLDAAQTYYLQLETDGAPLTLYGSALINETDYDFTLPFRVDGYDGFGGLYRGDLILQVYWDDSAEKSERFVTMLDQGDYILIPTNHQYAQITRLPERYPLTTAYYRALLGCPPEENIIHCYQVAEPGAYQGQLGFDLVATFTSYPTFKNLEINDQPAEEAFTFYDHPKVLIFRKNDQYTSNAVRELLGTVDLSSVVHLTPRSAAAYKDLMLPVERLAAQQAGGTWSELFHYDWPHNRNPVLGLLVWYVFILVLGLLTYPVVRLAFPGLADHGYPLSRALGLVLLAYFSWLVSSFGVPNTRPTVAIIFGLLALVGLALGWYQRDELLEEFRTRKKYFLQVELIFLSFFVFDLLIRLGNPDLWHPAKGGERPMDFSYFNAVIKSTTFPPYDPWFAGGYINYYYYGFVIAGMPVKLLGIVPSIAYNFILPTLFATAASCAFSIGWNLLASGQRIKKGQPGSFFTPLFSGLSAAAGVVLLGNLGTVRTINQGLQRLAAAPGTDVNQIGLIEKLVLTFQGFIKTLGGANLPVGRGEWYWNPSRVIPPGPGNEITEFPFFTFLYSDLHAHMIVMPLALLTIAWALSIFLKHDRWPGFGRLVLSFLVGGIVIGALYPTNLSDIYTYLPLALIAVICSLWRYTDFSRLKVFAGMPDWGRRLIVVVAGVVFLTVLAFSLYTPYRDWYGQAYSKLQQWKGPFTPLGSYLTHWGVFLYVIASWLLWETREWMAATPVSSLEKLKPYQLLIELALVLFIAALLALALLKISIGWIALPLALWSGILILRPDQPDAKRAVLFLVGTALVITIVVEVVVVVGDIGRMNTIFKFYLQSWLMLAISSAAAVAWLWQAMPTWPALRRSIWQVLGVMLLTGALLFTVSASLDKINDRMAPDAPHTLDAMDYMKYATYADQGVNMDLSQDYAAIRWLQDNAQGSVVIIEGNTVEYRWGTRYTIYTGLPGVVGWSWHQRQQRAQIPPNLITDRIEHITDFYTTTNTVLAQEYLGKYNVSYIILGQMERAYYAGPGLDKFEAYNGILWKEVFREHDTVIYEVIQ